MGGAMPIHFGTDGWRAIIGADYTYANVGRVLQAFCDLHAGFRGREVLVGYDRRFCSRQFAEEAVQVLAGNGFKVLFSEDFCPTPCISWMTKSRQALAGVVITASHNPFQWNGVKFKESYGGSASPELTRKIEERVQENQTRRRLAQKMSLEEAVHRGMLQSFDPHRDYLKQLKSLVNISRIRKAKLKVVVDSLYGAGSGFFSKLLPGQVFEIRGEENPSFGGVNPEPIEKNLKLAAQTVVRRRASLALATDGDADRIGAIDERGRFVDSHQIYSLILRHLLTVKKWSGDVVKTVSTTQMIDRIGERFGLKVIETPIGFKFICQEFQRCGSPLMGGEESGGIGVARHVYERDGILMGLFLLEIVAHHKKPLSKIVAELQKEYGPLYFFREDVHLSPDAIKKIRERLKTGRSLDFGAFKPTGQNTLDGFKYRFSDGSWLLIRPSGTEPLLRIYAEASSPKKAKQLIRAGLERVTAV
jgi:phosphomannomutase